MEQTQPPTLFAAAKCFWRNFAPAWVFPVFFLYGGLAAEEIGHPFLFMSFCAIPLFFWSFFRASRPWLQQKIKYWHCAFWAIIFPFIIWAFAVFSRLALLGL